MLILIMKFLFNNKFKEAQKQNNNSAIFETEFRYLLRGIS